MYNDTWTHKAAQYSAPFALAWGCSNRKFYSQLQLETHAGLRCGIVLPSLCSDKTFTFGHKPRQKWDLENLSQAK